MKKLEYQSIQTLNLQMVHKKLPDDINVPVVVGGKVINLGDIIFVALMQ
ncbi:hypothetical protein [Lysinibacillus fusiformis]|nr:hypothetical protein [Lysinibacillus fusiformis]WEA41245.1 hypothetical protein PWJ66_09990 [Lysinibacillus fusiformis]